MYLFVCLFQVTTLCEKLLPLIDPSGPALIQRRFGTYSSFFASMHHFLMRDHVAGTTIELRPLALQKVSTASSSSHLSTVSTQPRTAQASSPPAPRSPPLLTSSEDEALLTQAIQQVLCAAPLDLRTISSRLSHKLDKSVLDRLSTNPNVLQLQNFFLKHPELYQVVVRHPLNPTFALVSHPTNSTLVRFSDSVLSASYMASPAQPSAGPHQKLFAPSYLPPSEAAHIQQAFNYYSPFSVNAGSLNFTLI
jgi:hypothetical protein